MRHNLYLYLPGTQGGVTEGSNSSDEAISWVRGSTFGFFLGARDRNSRNLGWFSTRHFQLLGDGPLKEKRGGSLRIQETDEEMGGAEGTNLAVVLGVVIYHTLSKI